MTKDWAVYDGDEWEFFGTPEAAEKQAKARAKETSRPAMVYELVAAWDMGEPAPILIEPPRLAKSKKGRKK